MKNLIPILFFLFFHFSTIAQCTFQHQWTENYPVFQSALTPLLDKTGKPYVYVASNELGLKIYKINGATPQSVFTFSKTDLGMRPMSVTQEDTVLYVAIGSHFDTTSDDPPGVVSISVADPENPFILDTWIYPGNGSGCGIVQIEGNYAYVGGMGLGIFILNISDPYQMQLEGNLSLDVNYPFPNPANLDFYNVRGMQVRNSIAYVCYDGGGLRIINCTDPTQPVETGRYANPITYDATNNFSRAYNNIVLNDTLAYVAVDYCGVEILNVKDTSQITLVDHFNPHGCPLPGIWLGAPIHANELIYEPACEKLFVATGKSDMQVLDVSDPSNVSVCGTFGGISDDNGTWGITMRNDTIILSYIYTFFGVPFAADEPGIRMITWNEGCPLSNENDFNTEEKQFRVFPNPATVEQDLYLQTNASLIGGTILLYDMTGRLIHEGRIESNKYHLSSLNLSESIYQVIVYHQKEVYTEKIILIR